MIRLLDFGARTEYAIRALAHLTQHGMDAVVTVKELAEETGISVHFLYTIFDMLSRAGIVRPHRGIQRGFSLTRPADQISFYDILVAIEGPIEKHHCLLDHRAPCRAESPCAAHHLWHALREDAEQALQSVTLAQIAHQNPPWQRVAELLGR
jgi:Rrf2 family protein